MGCPCCGSKSVQDLMAVPNAPLSCATLFKTDRDALSSRSCNLNIVLCESCSHIYNDSFNSEFPDLYQSDYHSSVTASPQARLDQNNIASRLNDFVILKGKTVLEIGCGDGFFMNQLNSFGAELIGYEPSATFELVVNRPGILVHNSYFDFEAEENSHPSVDMVVMRHVLEHMEDPKHVLECFLNGIFKSPQPKYLFVEVPNAETMLTQDLYFDFYNDHIQYFSSVSLLHLLRLVGWKPIEELSSGTEFIRLLCVPGNEGTVPDVIDKKADRSSVEEMWSTAMRFKQDYSDWEVNLKSLLDSVIQKGAKLAIWGAGARGISLINFMRKMAVQPEYLVDTDVNKHGKYVPLTDLQVYPADHLHDNPVDYVMVSSYTFLDEIVTDLSWFSASGGKIIKIYPSPEVI